MKISKIVLVSVLVTMAFLQVNGQTTSPLSLVEATPDGCGQISDCSVNRICLDVMITPDTTGVISSYNIWLQYPPGGDLFYLSDQACLSSNGMDNNFDVQGYYRFAGVQGFTTVSENVPVKLHNICFTYTSIEDINQKMIQVGGTVFSILNSTLTYSMPVLNEPKMPAYPFTMNGTTITCILLPVHWLDFQATKLNTSTQLDWTTDEEINNLGFEVQRLTNGQIYENIGWVAANPVSNLINRYQFIDVTPKRGTNYYRLKQIDLDGNFDYSPVRWVIFQNPNFSVVITPIPAKDFLDIEIQTLAPSSQFKIIDLSGRVVLEETILGEDVKTQIILNNLAPGAYTVVVESGVETFITNIAVVY